MMGWSPRCYIPSFVEIGPSVPEKKIFKGFLPYMGMAAILVMGSASCHQTPGSFHKDLVQIGKVVSEKILFDVFVCTRPRAKVKNVFTFNTHIPSYIQLDDCSY